MAIKNGSIIAGRYRLERPISESGGTATVYLGGLADNAKHKVAIKFARSHSVGPMPEDMLLDREANLLRRSDWRHPGIVRIYPTPIDGQRASYSLNAIELPDRPRFMVMEYLNGGSLAENSKRIKNYPLGWKLEMFYQLLTAVAHLHQTGFGHRDLKPENIVFRETVSPNAIPIPVLVDFALASNGEERLAVVESSHTLEYASPERLLKTLGYDTLPSFPLKADIWSLGVILFELITGQHLIRGNESKVRTTIIKGAFNTEIDGRLVDCPQSVDTLSNLIRKMLDPDPNKRPSATMVMMAIEEIFPPPRLAVA